MKVAICHSRPVPPLDYGGTERVADWLCQGLLELGHEVVLLAPPGSIPRKGVRLVELDPARSWHGELVSRMPAGIDILHSMVPFTAEQELVLPAPSVTTIHGNGKPSERFSPWSIFVSGNHARRHGHTAFVYNGLDPSEFRLEPGRAREGAVFLAKTSWRVKNLRGAARFVRRSGMGFSIAGGNGPFSIQLEALLRPGWKWWGKVSGERKARLLSSGKVFVFPVQWEEPFGLVVVEALLSGTPVLATPCGSLPELLDDRVGRLIPVNQEELWIENLQSIDDGRLRFDPETCRSYALERFHYRKMAEDYVSYYRRRVVGSFWHSDGSS